MSPSLPIDWDATFLGDLPEDPGTSGYPEVPGSSGSSPKKVASQSIGSLGDIYFADTGTKPCSAPIVPTVGIVTGVPSPFLAGAERV